MGMIVGMRVRDWDQAAIWKFRTDEDAAAAVDGSDAGELHAGLRRIRRHLRASMKVGGP